MNSLAKYHKNITICVAGKNEIAIDITTFIKEHYPEIKLVALTNKADNGVNGFFKSFKWYLNQQGIPITTLEELYTIPNLVFLSLEFDTIVKPHLFLSQKFFNIHFSLLPAYKGMYTSAWPILNNEKYSGVTLHKIDRGIDTGDIIAQVKFKMDKKESVKSLYKKYMVYGTELIKQYFPDILKENFKSKKQSYKGSTYYSKTSIDYKNLKINLNVTAQQLDAQIRAFAYREYQIPEVYAYKIHHAEITKINSQGAAGKIVTDNEFALILHTIDYDVILYKDRFEECINACKTNNTEILKHLIKHIDLEERTNEGWTPLIVACYNNAIDAVEILLQHKANVNAVNFKGTSVLMYSKDAALNTNSTDILDIILRSKPDIKHKDIYQKDIFDYLENQSSEMAAYIRKKQGHKA